MVIWSKLLGYEDEIAPPAKRAPEFRNDKIPGTLDLGLHYSEGRNEIQVAKISGEDRSTHLYVVGATGTGKTKFLESLIRQDITSGNGFCVIDPHGDLVEDIKRYLCCYAQPRDLEDAILIDPTDPNYSVAFNPLEPLPGISVTEQAEEFLCSFRKIWSGSWGTRMEDLMRHSLIALGEAGMTLCEVAPFLTRRSFRETVLEGTHNCATQDYFRRFDSLTDRAQITWAEPVMNKMDALLADERLRQMLSSPKSTFQFREAMDGKKRILIKLDKGKLKGSSDLLGSLFMAKIQMAAFSRSDLEKSRRIPFYLYIDEFQNFATESFKVALSEARKYGLSLIMAHQSLSQIPDDLKSLILGSAGIQAYFRVNRQDAQVLAKEAFHYSGSWEREIEELQHLPPRTCYVKHKISGGIIRLHTQKVDAAAEMPAPDALSNFGMRYLLRREKLVAEADQRQRSVEEATRARVQAATEQTPSAPLESVSRPASRESVDLQSKDEMRPPQCLSETEVGMVQAPASVQVQKASLSPDIKDAKVDREHRRLQHLVKRLAEPSGYKAVLEQPTKDGLGRVDVALVRENTSIACEISVTTSAEHELANIRKCLASGYDQVILCSQDKKTLERIRGLCASELTDADLARVSFLEPDELALLFEEDAARNAGKVQRIKGYRVKVKYQAVQETEKETKRQAIAQVLLQSLRRSSD